MSFNFDKMSKLAMDNPVEFEAERKRLIENQISKCSPEDQVALRALQSELDFLRSVMPDDEFNLYILQRITKNLERIREQLISILKEIDRITRDPE